MKLVLAIVKPFKLTEIVDAVAMDARFPGMTAFQVKGFGREKSAPHEHTRAEELRDFVEHAAAIVATPDELVGDVVDLIEKTAHTGLAGDGKIFVLNLEQAVRIATGERGEQALR
jgi:nitrogen regulatory protein PII